MPENKTVDDVENDDPILAETKRKALETKASTNTKKETTDEKKVKDSDSSGDGNPRTDTDGKWKRDDGFGSVFGQTSSGGGNQSSGGSNSGGGSTSGSENTILSDFFNNLFGSSTGNQTTSGGGGGNAGGGGGNAGGGGGNAGGGDDDTGGGDDDTGGKTDEEIDEPTEKQEGDNQVGSDRSGGFGNPPADETNNESPKVVFSRRNKSKGVTVKYKGVTYTVDTKGTESTADGGGDQEWLDDTFTVGTTVINLSQFNSKSPEEKLAIMNNALGIPNDTPSDTKRLNVDILDWNLKPGTKYGAVVFVRFKVGPSDLERRFDDNGIITVGETGLKFDNTTYKADEVFYQNQSVVEWVKEKVDSTKSEQLKALYIGWGFTVEEKSNNSDTPEDPNSADPTEKFEAKPKSSKSPEGAPEKVENSVAPTTARLRELKEGEPNPPNSIILQNQKDNFKSLAEIPPYVTSKGWYGFRLQDGTHPFGKTENEYNVPVSKLTNAVRKFFDSSWSRLIKSTGRGVNPSSNDILLNLIDYPIIMNFPEVGVWNKTVPYVASTQTEQHRMISEAYISNSQNWGIGTYGGGFANWAEEPHWCGLFTNHCINHGGYKLANPTSGMAGANNINESYFDLKNIYVDKYTTGCIGNFPAYIDPKTGVETMHDDVKVLKAHSNIVNAGKKGKLYLCTMYGSYYTKDVKQKTVVRETTMVTKGKKVKPIVKDKITEGERIAITVYESLLPDPKFVVFIAGVHYTPGGLTDMGKKLIEHLLSQRGWEAAIISRGGHIEVCPYVNPDGSFARFGGNTASGFVTGAGGKFAASRKTLYEFTSYPSYRPGTFVAFSKIEPRAGSQKIEPTLNGQFKRTQIVDSYYRAIKSDKNVLSTLKTRLYDAMVEPE